LRPIRLTSIGQREVLLKTFAEYPLLEPLQAALKSLGLVEPTPIQNMALPHLLSGPTDFLGLAATGTGKTAAFVLPMLNKLNPTKRGVQTLILCPTRELALQVAGQVDAIGKNLRVRSLTVYGGAGYKEQISGLKRGVSVVVGTPGRVLDHLRRGTLKLDDVETLILDEADEMISMGFREDIETVLEALNRERSNIWLFSATMSRDVRYLVDEYLDNYKEVKANTKQMLPKQIKQSFCVARESDRPDLLCKFIEHAQEFYGLIFCQTKAQVMELGTFLTSRGYKVDTLHGDKTQKDRERAMDAFRSKNVRILVCTDVAARGLDVKEVTHVVNFSVPRELDSYVHRIGRTGRSGATGEAISFIAPQGRGLIRRLEQMTKSKIEERRPPSLKEIGRVKVLNNLESFTRQQHHQRAMVHLNEDWKKTLEEMSHEEIAGRFLAMLEPEIFSGSFKL
jgi:ATP-dependent RNA helicase DeaD